MKVSDLVKIWYEDVEDKKYDLPPIYGVFMNETEGWNVKPSSAARRNFTIYVEGRPASYWEEDWDFEVISEAR